MSTALSLDSILNFIIPYLVWGFIIWVIYRIPIVNEGIDKLKDWWANRQARKEGEVEESFTLRTISYE